MNARISTTQPATQEREVTPQLLPLNEQTIMILGRPNFACSFTAQRMRELGHKIKRTSQDEQAAVIHMLINMYQRHGDAWFEHANAYLESGRSAATPVATTTAAGQ